MNSRDSAELRKADIDRFGAIYPEKHHWSMGLGPITGHSKSPSFVTGTRNSQIAARAMAEGRYLRRGSLDASISDGCDVFPDWPGNYSLNA